MVDAVGVVEASAAAVDAAESAVDALNVTFPGLGDLYESVIMAPVAEDNLIDELQITEVDIA